MIGAPGADECSRAGCHEQATTQIHWRNPRIHDARRRKIWLACDAHVEYLTEFLRARSFPVETVPHAGETSQ